jgi:hypothetical protein
MEILDFDEFSMRLEKLTVLGAKNPNADWNLRSNYSGKDFKCGCGKKHKFIADVTNILWRRALTSGAMILQDPMCDFACYIEIKGVFTSRLETIYSSNTKSALEDYRANLEEGKHDPQLICPECKTSEKIHNLFKRKSAKIFIYNEKSPRVRKSDGLHIYPMLCFNCKTVCEFASDPQNNSGKAVKGIEYIRYKKMNAKNKKDALNEAKSKQLKHFIDKIKKLRA